VVDIGALRTLLREVLAPLDYQNVDEHPAFPDRSSTTERVATYIADQLAARLAAFPEEARPSAGAMLRVLLRESPVAYAAYERGLR
jgi:6-pyruvoyltetrahydropterin/6-carboxytetrahydropterin synthase